MENLYRKLGVQYKCTCPIPFDFGYGWDYTLDRGNLAMEAFAEMTAASIASPESLGQIQKYLPNAYAAYREIIRRII